VTTNRKLPAKGIDLSQLAPRIAHDKGHEMELLHPISGAPLNMFVTVVGRESTAFKKFAREQANDTLRHDALVRAGKEEPRIPTVESIEQTAISACIACTLGWRNIVWDGVELEFSPENLQMLYQEEWIRAQVDDAITDSTNFIQS
jgi:hypothetical protein